MVAQKLFENLHKMIMYLHQHHQHFLLIHMYLCLDPLKVIMIANVFLYNLQIVLVGYCISYILYIHEPKQRLPSLVVLLLFRVVFL